MFQKNIPAAFRTAFGVPLDTENGEGVVYDSLYYVVAGTADCAKRKPKAVNALMMGRVYDRAQTVKLIEKVIPPQATVVDRMLLIVPDPLMDRGCIKILMDIAAKVDVDQLDSFTDSENGPFSLDIEIQDLKLENIQFGINGTGAVVVLTKECRCDIATAGEDEVIRQGGFFFVEGGKDLCAQSAEGFFIILCIPASAGNDDIGLRGHGVLLSDSYEYDMTGGKECDTKYLRFFVRFLCFFSNNGCAFVGNTI